mgnify:CR=1 FL=1
MGVVNGQTLGYTKRAAEKKAAGFGTPKIERWTPATRRYFFVQLPSCAFFNGRALAGTASAVPVSFVPGSNLVKCPLSRLEPGSD